MIARFSFTALTALCLTGCLAVPPTEAPNLLRNPTVPLAITTRGGTEAMAGNWHIRASSPGYRDIRTLTFNTRGDAQQSVSFQKIGTEPATDGWMAEPLAQNRWRLSSEIDDSDMELWVIWIDDGYRTAAIGSPDSDMAFILDRKPKGGADRMTAAREVLAFNGYNMDAFITH